MSHLQANLGKDDVLALLDRATGFLTPRAKAETPPQGVNNQTYLVREAGLAVTIRPGGGDPPTVPCRPWPAHACALLGDRPNGGVRSLACVTEILQRHGGLPVPAIVHHGEGTGPGGSDFTISEALPGRPFGWETDRMGRRACRQLGEHLGRLHAATVRTEGFGVFGAEPMPWTQWWPRFTASYRLVADDVCAASPLLGGFRARLEAPLARAIRSPDPRAFPLVCVDQSPTRYLGDENGRIVGFGDVEGHLWAPAEWELTTVLMWLPHPRAFRDAYEAHRPWPIAMDGVRDAYATYALLGWLVCARDLVESPMEVSNLEALLIGSLA